jgi:hypothetical protein
MRAPSPFPARPSLRAALLLLALVGCPFPGPSDPPPQETPWDPAPIERDPACTLTGTLELGLGNGNGPQEFTPLAPGQGPRVYNGSQGGQHLELGVRVANPATAFPGLQLHILAEAEPCDFTGPCRPYEKMGELRTRVLEKERFLPQDGGAVAVSGLILFVDSWPHTWKRRLTVEAADRCGRTGTLTLERPAGAP